MWSVGTVFTLAVTVNVIVAVLDDGARLPLWATVLQGVVVGAAALSPSVVFSLWDGGLLPGAGEARQAAGASAAGCAGAGWDDRPKEHP